MSERTRRVAETSARNPTSSLSRRLGVGVKALETNVMLADGRVPRPRRFRLVMLPSIGAQANITRARLTGTREPESCLCGPRAGATWRTAYCQSTMIMPNAASISGRNAGAEVVELNAPAYRAPEVQGKLAARKNGRSLVVSVTTMLRQLGSHASRKSL